MYYSSQCASGLVIFHSLYFNKSDRPYSPLGIFAILRYSIIAFTKVCGLLK